jgi:hypothetical protein
MILVVQLFNAIRNQQRQGVDEEEAKNVKEEEKLTKKKFLDLLKTSKESEN